MRNFLASILLSFLISASSAQPTEFLVAIDENLYPYTFIGRDGKATGADVELMQLAAKQTGLSIKFLPLPWKRVLQMLETGEAPLGMPLFFTPERNKYAEYITPVHFSATTLFVQKNRAIAIKSIHDLYGKRIGYNRGYAPPEELALAIAEGKVFTEEVNSTQQNIQKLLLGRLDGFVGNYVNTTTAMQTIAGSDNIVSIPDLFVTDRPAYLVFSKQATIPDRARIEQRLRKAMEGLHREGIAEQILFSYMKAKN